MRTKGRAVFLAGAALAVLVAHAHSAGEEPRTPQKIPPKMALEVALAHNQEYKIAVQKLEMARERVRKSWGQLMPALESEASVMRQDAESGPMSLTDGQYDIKVVQIRFGINPGSFYNTLQLSRKEYLVAREDVRRVRGDVEYNVISSYFNLLLAGEMITLRRDSLGFLKSNLKDVQNLYRTGSVPRFELLQAQVQLKNQEPLLLDAENQHAVQLDTFNFHLGAGGVEYAADEEVLKIDRFRSPGGAARQKIDSLVAVALRNRPEIIQLENKREMAEHAEGVASAHYLWPVFTVGGYYGMTRFYNPYDPGVTVPGFGPMGPVPLDFSRLIGTPDWQNTWQVRAAATYRWGSLIPADPARAAEREERARIKEAEEELLRLKRLIAISIHSGYTRLVTSYLIIVSQKGNVATAEEGLRIAKESYRAGVIKNSELLSSELALTDARTNYIRAANGYYISLASLKRELGVEDERQILEETEKWTGKN